MLGAHGTGGRNDPIRRVIQAYDDPLIRLYSSLRFRILRQRFLDEIGQYLPAQGRVLDVGCGFGLFSLYYAQILPHVTFQGFDLSLKRIEMARRAADRLGLRNVSYEVRDAAQVSAETQWDAVYMLDVVHHVAESAVPAMLGELATSIRPGGRLIIKDLDTSPGYKRIYSRALDWAMSPSSPVCYWPPRKLIALLEDLGLTIRQHAMVDYLPYPHILYVCSRATTASSYSSKSAT